MRGMQNGFTHFSHTLAGIVNALLLSIVYIVGVGLTHAFARLKKKKFLKTTSSPNENTYWTDLNLRKKPLEEYYRQF